MIEPISAIFAFNFLVGMVGNVASAHVDDGLRSALRKLRDGSSRQTRPLNHDLYGAVWWGFLTAGVLHCDGCLERGESDVSLWSRLTDPPTRSEEMQALWEVRRQLERQVEEPVLTPEALDQSLVDHDRLVVDAGKDPLSLADFTGRADGALAALEPHATAWFFGVARALAGGKLLPKEFESSVRDGDGLDRPKWFQLARECFVERLKKDEPAWRAFQIQCLAAQRTETAALPDLDELERQLDAQSEELREQFDRQTDALQHWLAPRLSDVDERLQEAVAGLEGVWTQLDSLRQSLASLEAGGVETLVADLHRLRERLNAADEFAEHFAAATRAAVEDRIDEFETRVLVGRNALGDELDRVLRERESASILLAGASGSGKSAFLARWVREHQAKGAFVAYHFVSQVKPELTADPEQCWRNLLGQVLAYHDGSPAALAARVSSADDLFALLSKEADARQPLVVVIDSLDELRWPTRPQSPFPDPLPAGVYLIASTRLDEEVFLRPSAWPRDELLEMPSGLAAEEIGQWLQQAGDGELADLATDEELLRQLAQKSDGLPLYLRFAIEDVLHARRSGEDVRAHVAALPTGLAQFVEDAFIELSGDPEAKRLVPMFDFLAVAKSPLAADDIRQLTGISERDALGAGRSFQRWLRVTKTEKRSTVLGFQHPAIARAYAGVDAFRSEISEARRTLIGYCTRWSENASRYALGNVVDHLAEEAEQGQDPEAEEARQKIVELAGDDEFLSQQRTAFPDDPDLPLRTLLAGFVNALEAYKIQEAVRILSARSEMISRLETPLEVLRSGGSVERALALAAFHQEPQRTLWLLLLASELARHGRIDDAEEALTRVDPRAAESMESPHYDLLLGLIVLLSQLLADPRLLGLAARTPARVDLFRDLFRPRKNVLARVASTLVDTGQVQAALAIASERPEAAAAVAGALAKAGQAEWALEAAGSIDDAWWQAEAMGEVAAGLAHAGLDPSQAIKAALEVAGSIEDGWSRCGTMALVASELARAGLDSSTTFEEALEAACSIPDATTRARAIAAVTHTLAETGQLEAALKTAGSIDDAFEKAKAMAVVAGALAHAGLDSSQAFDDALEAAGSTKDAIDRDIATAKVAGALAEAGQVGTALEIANSVENYFVRQRATLDMARGLAKAGQLQSALEATDPIEDADEQARALADVAQGLAEAGHVEAALLAAGSIEDVYWRGAATAIVGVTRDVASVTTDSSQAFEAALDDARSAEDAGERAEAIVWVARALAEAGQVEAALYAARSIEDPLVRARAMGVVAQTLARAGQPAAALEVVVSIEEPTWRALSLGEVVETLARADADSSRVSDVTSRVSDAALEAAGSIEDAWFRTVALGRLAHGFAGAGVDPSRAVEAAIDAAGSCEAGMKRDIAMSLLADELAAGQLGTEALEVAGSINDAVIRARAIAGVASKLAHAGLGSSRAIEAAHQAAGSIEAPHRRADAMEAVAAGLAHGGQPEAALEVVDSIEDAERRATAMAGVAAGLAQAGHRESALSSVRSIEDASKRAAAMANVARGLAEAGQVEEALVVADSIEDAALDDAHWEELLLEVVKWHVSSGRTAVETLGRMASRSRGSYHVWIALVVAYPEAALAVADVLAGRMQRAQRG